MSSKLSTTLYRHPVKSRHLHPAHPKKTRQSQPLLTLLKHACARAAQCPASCSTTSLAPDEGDFGDFFGDEALSLMVYDLALRLRKKLVGSCRSAIFDSLRGRQEHVSADWCCIYCGSLPGVVEMPGVTGINDLIWQRSNIKLNRTLYRRLKLAKERLDKVTILGLIYSTK